MDKTELLIKELEIKQMISNFKMNLMSKLKFQYILKDPFPEHTIYESFKKNKDMISFMDKYFGTIEDDKPKSISIWEAYRKGQEDVYSRLSKILEELNEK